MLRSKEMTIARLMSADRTIAAHVTDCHNGGGGRGSSTSDMNDDDIYGLPPAAADAQLEAAIDEANYDDIPAITGLTEIKEGAKYSTILGHFMRCKAMPCNIEHWTYLGDKCYYREAVHKDRKAHNASVWAVVQNSTLYSLENDFGCPVEICRSHWEEEINSTRQVTHRTLLEHYQNDTPWNMDDMYLGNAYIRINQFFGIEYMFHGGFTLTSPTGDGDDTVTLNKSGTITIRRGFTHNFCDVSFDGDVASVETPVYVIVPYTGRIDQLRLFYANIKSLLDQGIALRVVLATHGGAVHTLGATELLRELDIGLVEGELSDGHIIQVVEARGDKHGKFSRAYALQDGLAYAPADALVFFCDVDMTILPQFFDNCRHNVHRNHRVYYPVVYSLYPYGTKVSREHGYWRHGAYGMLCAYKSDIKRNMFWKWKLKKLSGWGMEDVWIRKGFNNHWQISVFHAVEPNLLHRWHPKYCEWGANIAACLGTIFQNMGSHRFLAAIVADKGIDVRTIPYDPAPVIFEDYRNASDPSTGDSDMENGRAPESATDQNKIVAMKAAYERAIMSGEGGLISLLAKEAQDAILGTTSDAASQIVPAAAPRPGTVTAPGQVQPQQPPPQQQPPPPQTDNSQPEQPQPPPSEHLQRHAVAMDGAPPGAPNIAQPDNVQPVQPQAPPEPAQQAATVDENQAPGAPAPESGNEALNN